MTAEMSDDLVDVTTLLDDEPVGGLLIRVVALCAAVALLDGSNTTSIGVAAPLIAGKLGLSIAHLGPIFSAATLGAMLGALSFGPLADRFGRKRMLVIATAVFGAFTIATARADTFESLLVVRFFAGIGLGGAAPCFIALASEYAPSPHRALVTTLIWTAFPLGVILGAILNAYLLAHAEWPVIFVVGGTMSLVVCVVVTMWLPESVRFLLLRKPGSDEIRRIVSRIRPSLRGARLYSREIRTRGTPFKSLFSDGRAIDTVLIWIAFMAAFGMTAATFFWSPVLLHIHGVPLAKASLIVGVGAGVGSLAGAAGAGFLIEKVGSTAALTSTFLLATLSTAALGYAAASPVALIIDVVANGILIAGVSTAGMLAISAGIYPVAMRSTGVGCAMGLGRFGEVVIPLLIALMITITGGLDKEVFLVLAVAPFLGALSIMWFWWRNLRTRVTSPGALASNEAA